MEWYNNGVEINDDEINIQKNLDDNKNVETEAYVDTLTHNSGNVTHIFKSSSWAIKLTSPIYLYLMIMLIWQTISPITRSLGYSL